ncbi:MAG: repeat-containing protein [Bacteroidetes bacterium]|nr:repeat-containing protein [Bacteroidota bacterium]
MKKILINVLFLLFLSFVNNVGLFAQNESQEVSDLIKTAVFKMDNGDLDESILLLEKAEKMDSKSALVKYEMSYAYYLKKDYNKSIKILNKLIKRDDALDYYYQMLGNAYDDNGESDKAIKTYAEGIKRFPNSGKLFLETGNVYYNQKDYDSAIRWYEKGVEADPKYPSNYFRMAHLFLNSDQEVWGMIYGEIFLNLEPSTKRSNVMSEMLYNTYKNEIKFEDTVSKVSFSKQVININYDPDKEADLLAKMTKAYEDSKNVSKMPWANGVYEQVMLLALGDEKEINLASLNRIRSNFVDIYFEKAHNVGKSVLLFDFQKRLKDAGYFETYNYWLLSQGNVEEFNQWLKDNKDKYDGFIYWMNNNSLQVDESNVFLIKNLDRD